MKHSALITALLTTAVLAMAPAPASAQGLAGMWELSRETGRSRSGRAAAARSVNVPLSHKDGRWKLIF